MATYRDLDPLPYFGEQFSDMLRAVGWLGRDQPFKKGPTPEAVYWRLKELLANAFEPFMSMGFHVCELCQFEDEIAGFRAGCSGSHNLFVPAEGKLFVCPELILHYITGHGYQPPDVFCDAVLACPDTQTSEYEKQFLENGGRKLIQHTG